MRSKNYKGRCTKRSFSKCADVVKTYDKVQEAFAEVLENDPEIESFQSNVLLKGIANDEYMTDFYCRKKNGEFCVWECTYRNRLLLPRTTKLLDSSRNYWRARGVTDWGIVVEKLQEDIIDAGEE